MNKKTVFLVILILLLGIGLGLFFYWLFGSKDTSSEIIEPDITKELAIIDSLTIELDKKNQEIQELREKSKKIKTVVIEKIEQIKILPLDTNIIIMKENLLEYGEITEPVDSIRLISFESDTNVLITPGMVRDVNIITTKYSGELEQNRLLGDEIIKLSEIIVIKDSLIINKDEIMRKQMEAYKHNIDALESQVMKEKKEKRKVAWILGTTTAVSIAIAILK